MIVFLKVKKINFFIKLKSLNLWKYKVLFLPFNAQLNFLQILLTLFLCINRALSLKVHAKVFLYHSEPVHPYFF
jgi:hypothetical protein